MSWHRDGRGGRRSYHHGNLREALISAALELIAQKGPAGFTFAEAARAGRRQPGRALPPFPRPRRADGRRRPARLRALRAAPRRRLGRGPAEPARRARAHGPRLSRLRARGAGLLLGHVRGGRAARRASRAAGGRRPRLRRAARRLRGGRRRPAGGQAPARHDDGAAHLGAVARHRQPVRARRCGAAHVADDAGGAAGGGRRWSTCRAWASRPRGA